MSGTIRLLYAVVAWTEKTLLLLVRKYAEGFMLRMKCIGCVPLLSLNKRSLLAPGVKTLGDSFI
jgi:hypothetical protein